MADFVVDDFSGTDGQEVDDRTGATGATWTQVLGDGDATQELEIAGNNLRGSGNNEASYWASGTPASADYDVVVNFDFLSSAGNLLIGFFGRYSTDGQNGIQVALNGFDDSLYLTEYVGGVENSLDTPVPWTAADQTIKLELRGTAVNVYIDTGGGYGAAVLTGTTAVTGAGRVGLYKYSETAGADFYRIVGITASDAVVATASVAPPRFRLVRRADQSQLTRRPA